MSTNNEQISMDLINKGEKVIVLGMEFKNDDERREYFREELRKKLPELKNIEGYPVGEDEDIIELSDPPYYTICPNPWIKKIVSEWKQKISKKKVVNQPLAVDVSEGKNDPIYTAHTYHTKVPYKAIMRYMLHYTNPGDIVYDGFSGTGMTGVAAEKCADIEVVKDVLKEEFKVERVGKRNAVLVDIAPAASFIGLNHSKKTKMPDTVKVLEKVIKKLREQFDWSFKTLASPKEQENIELDSFYANNSEYFGEINYIIWSEVYICPSCFCEFNYWEATVNEKEGKDTVKELKCPNCDAKLNKRNLEKVRESMYDSVTNEVELVPKTIAIRINYTYNGKRYNKKPDWYDLLTTEYFKSYSGYSQLIQKKFKNGGETNRLIKDGLLYFHQVYTKRNLSLLDKFLEISNENNIKIDSQFLLGSTISRLSKFNRYMPKHNRHVGPMANALYLPPTSVEINPMSQLELQLKKLRKSWEENQYSGNIITNQSSTKVELDDNSIDYIFIDPPFGANIMYSELSFIREAWLRVFTNDKEEAIENKFQNKNLNDYTTLMSKSFVEAYRILKPDSWITVEFSNTSAAVWNSLQVSIQSAGFIIASVDALDKKRGGFHGIITTTGVKQDLVISAYKPSKENKEKILECRNTMESVWIFIKQHLEKLPVFIGNKGESSIIVERTPRILFDRMIAYHVQTGISVPISSLEFQQELVSRYLVRDGMIFLETQALEYDRKRILNKEFIQQTLFISDENSAIEWLRQQLLKKPQTRQDIRPKFMKEIMSIAKHEELPELDDLLEQNFLQYDNNSSVPNQIRTYLTQTYHDLRGLSNDEKKIKERASNRWYVPNPNQQADLEKLREKNLLREFNRYVEEINSSKKKLKVFRTEAIRVGFKKAWTDKDYQKIVNIGDRLPEKIIREDDKLLMYYDNALMRTEI